MKILGLDIATSTGYALIEKGKVIDYGIIKLKQKDDHRKRLQQLRREVVELLMKHNPEIVALETIYVSNMRVKGGRGNPKTAALLNRMRGVVMECVPQEVKLIDVVNKTAKKDVIGRGNCKKEDVFEWAIDYYPINGLKFKKHNDITDAILLATWAEENTNKQE